MKRRTTIELADALLARARRALGGSTTRTTVTEALRRLAESAEAAQDKAHSRQNDYFEQLSARADLGVLSSEDMWR